MLLYTDLSVVDATLQYGLIQARVTLFFLFILLLPDYCGQNFRWTLMSLSVSTIVKVKWNFQTRPGLPCHRTDCLMLQQTKKVSSLKIKISPIYHSPNQVCLHATGTCHTCKRWHEHAASLKAAVDSLASNMTGTSSFWVTERHFEDTTWAAWRHVKLDYLVHCEEFFPSVNFSNGHVD